MLIIIVTKAPWHGWWLHLIGKILTQCGVPCNKYLLEDVLRGKNYKWWKEDLYVLQHFRCNSE